MNIKEKKILRYINVAYALSMVPVIIFLLPIDKLIEKSPSVIFLFVSYITLICYINLRFNITALIIKRKFLYAGSILLLTFAITGFFDVFLMKEPHLDKLDSFPKLLENLRSRTIWSFYIINMSFGLMTGLIGELYRQILHRQAVESEKNKAEIALYKAQINPHFMFNTLNTLYGLFISKSDQAEEVFIKFTNILKYMYINAEQDKISFNEELNYIKEYIELQSLRLGRHTTVDFKCESDDDAVMVAPMILITFVENAFKYGISSTSESVIDISIHLENNKLTFVSTNLVHNKAINSNSGIGIINCRKRLDLLYPQKYSLDCELIDQTFNVKLIIQL